MDNYKCDVLGELAKLKGVSVEKIRKEIQIAIDSGLSNPDPVIQANWAKIPKKGAKHTPEEVIAYMAEKIKHDF